MTTVKQSDLLRAIGIVQGALGTKSSLPVLDNFLMAYHDGRLTLAATNLDIFIVARVDAQGDEAWAITVPAKRLADTVATFPAGDVVLSTNDRLVTLDVKAGRMSSKLKGIEAAEFPKLLTTGVPGINLPAKALVAAIAATAYAASTDQARPMLTALALHLTGDGQNSKLSLIGADGFRMGLYVATVASALEGEVAAAVPAKALALLGKLLGREEGDVMFYLKDNQVVAETGDMLFAAQVVQGQTPNYEGVIPVGSTTVVTVSRDDLLRACRLADVLAADSAHTVRCDIRPGAQTLTISAVSAELGTNDSEIKLAEADGPDLLIAFNVKYIQDCVGSMTEAENVTLRLQNATSPGLIVPSDLPEGVERWIGVTMPMHLTK